MISLFYCKTFELVIHVNDTFKPTIAGLLLFGKDRVSKYLPQAGIMCVKVKGAKITDDKEDHKFFEGNAFDNFRESVRFFNLYNKTSFVIEGSLRKNVYDYPEKAFRELLANALVHRDYTIAGSQISVWVYDNRIEIKSPRKTAEYGNY